MARVTSKLDKSEARGGFEITSAITSWIVQHEVQLLIVTITKLEKNMAVV